MLRCPKCNQESIYTKDSVNYGVFKKRRRGCKLCGYVYNTIELEYKAKKLTSKVLSEMSNIISTIGTKDPVQ